MLTLINLLIIFFIALIFYQIILASNDSIVEGFAFGSPVPPPPPGIPAGIPPNSSANTNSGSSTYQPYDTNNPNNALILAQQNAGNISVLKSQLDDLNGLNKEVQDISGNVVTLQNQVTQLVTAQKQYADQMTGGSAPNVSGTGSTSSTNTSNLVTS